MTEEKMTVAYLETQIPAIRKCISERLERHPKIKTVDYNGDTPSSHIAAIDARTKIDELKEGVPLDLMRITAATEGLIALIENENCELLSIPRFDGFSINGGDLCTKVSCSVTNYKGGSSSCS